MTPVWADHAMVLAQGGGLGTHGLQDWMLQNLVPLGLLVVAMLLLFLGGGRGDNAGVAKRVGGVFIALGIIGLAVTNAGVDIGTFLAGLFHR